MSDIDYKFKVNQRVKKRKGYHFRGVVRSRYHVDGGNRYDVQIDNHPARADIHEWLTPAFRDGYFTTEQYQKMDKLMLNCQGMIHIFAEEQLEHE